MSDYTDRVEANLEGCKFASVGGTEECQGCKDAGYTEYSGDEGSFSWSGCGICGSSLGGTRYIWHWVDEDGEMIHGDDACQDCLLYLANGEEPEEEESR